MNYSTGWVVRRRASGEAMRYRHKPSHAELHGDRQIESWVITDVHHKTHVARFHLSTGVNHCVPVIIPKTRSSFCYRGSHRTGKWIRREKYILDFTVYAYVQMFFNRHTIVRFGNRFRLLTIPIFKISKSSKNLSFTKTSQQFNSCAAQWHWEVTPVICFVKFCCRLKRLAFLKTQRFWTANIIFHYFYSTSTHT